MRTIEEIKADLAKAEKCEELINSCTEECDNCEWDIDRNTIDLKIELFNALTNAIPLDRLEVLCQAEREAIICVPAAEIELEDGGDTWDKEQYRDEGARVD